MAGLEAAIVAKVVVALCESKLLRLCPNLMGRSSELRGDASRVSVRIAPTQIFFFFGRPPLDTGRQAVFCADLSDGLTATAKTFGDGVPAFTVPDLLDN